MKLEILDVSKDEAIWASDFQTYNPRCLEWVRNCYDFILVTNPTVDISINNYRKRFRDEEADNVKFFEQIKVLGCQ